MGLFDLFKKKSQKKEPAKKAQQQNTDDSERNERAHEIAFALMSFEGVKKDYSAYKSELKKKLDLNDEKIILSTVGLILHYYYKGNKADSKFLFDKLREDYPNNEDITCIYLEVICTMNIPNDQEFAKKYLDYKYSKHDFNHQYKAEYQKGLELKQRKFYEEAINLWSNLNKIQEFSWNYYQIGITQNLIGDPNCITNIARAIEMDDEIKKDAKVYPELDNLRKNAEFLKLLE